MCHKNISLTKFSTQFLSSIPSYMYVWNFPLQSTQKKDRTIVLISSFIYILILVSYIISILHKKPAEHYFVYTHHTGIENYKAVIYLFEKWNSIYSKLKNPAKNTPNLIISASETLPPMTTPIISTNNCVCVRLMWLRISQPSLKHTGLSYHKFNNHIIYDYSNQHYSKPKWWTIQQIHVRMARVFTGN